MSTIDPSAIDQNAPAQGEATTASVRANETATANQLQNAKNDIEALEAHPPRTDNPHGVTAAQAGALEDVFTADGDIVTRQAGSTAKVPIGTAGQVLKVTAGLPAWEDETAGGSGTVQDIAKDGSVIVADATQIDFRDSGDATVTV